MNKAIILMFSFLTLWLSGCQLQAREGYEPQEEDVNGLRLMKDGHATYDEQELEDEPYVTNQNPNFIDLTESRPDLGTDQNKLEEAIMNDPELSLGRVIINGNQIHVKVFTTESLTKEEEKQRTKDIHKKMITALPRYEIDVELEEK
ncbi:hypothetical protein [Bacillus weihaiensis]|uniref:Sporulation protein n=1 Tax=Bacillus weihaiensis TaxID=1547283 RepID=A0A1L3MM01_9BACI|nr:hypothetical protein [Bacillus weihaiensis]APH03369.1 hypothetical protein A9C19_00585 [Bacillus weihaiensis]